MGADDVRRTQLLALLDGGHAHMSFDEAIADFPMGQINTTPQNVPYTPWHLLEHLRLTQRDILDFVREASYTEMPWPEGYWPARDAQADPAAWQRTIEQFHEDLREIRAMVADPQTDLEAPLPFGRGHSLLREILLVADHNGYHIGEFAILRQVMETWPTGR